MKTQLEVAIEILRDAIENQSAEQIKDTTAPAVLKFLEEYQYFSQEDVSLEEIGLRLEKEIVN